jgi:molybdopterin synthase catalytic subunit
VSVSIQEADFDLGAEIAALTAEGAEVGAIASFVGVVRGGAILSMTLEHYPGMTEKALNEIVAEARRRWELLGVRIIHRIGKLLPGDRIVLVAVSSSHRQAAFAACEFVMDHLKTQAPFWKWEETRTGGRWVDARDSDDQTVKRWLSP